MKLSDLREINLQTYDFEISDKVDQAKLLNLVETFYNSNVELTEDIVVSKSEAARLWNVSRQRANAIFKHPSNSFRFEGSGRKQSVYLADVLRFEGRLKFTGKRGKQKNGL